MFKSRQSLCSEHLSHLPTTK